MTRARRDRAGTGEFGPLDLLDAPTKKSPIFGISNQRIQAFGRNLVATSPAPIRPYTSKQMGDACEMLVAAELTLAGVPALKVPDNWPGYDVVAQRKVGGVPIRISVKSRTYIRGAAFVSFYVDDLFDWLAIVLLNCDHEQNRRIFIIPAAVAHSEARRNKPTAKNANARYWRIDEVATRFSRFENNFKLLADQED